MAESDFAMDRSNSDCTMSGSDYPCPHVASSLCPHYRYGICPDAMVVPFSGPDDARLIIIGEAPGRNEHERGIPFVGDSGHELDNLYLPAAGMARPWVAVANSVSCLPQQKGSSRRPSSELIEHCSQHVLLPWLNRMLEQRDRVVVCLGEISARVVAGDNPPEVGIIHPLPGGWLLCGPHPAAAMRSASRAGRIMDEILLTFRTAGALLRNPDSVLVCPERCQMRLCRDVDDLISWLGDADTVGMDTETMGFASGIYCSSYARDGRSAVLLGQDTDWQKLVDWLCQRTVVLHNALYDIGAIESEAGPEAADRLLEVAEDTMLLAYEFRGLPLGLKPLASMLCGYQMRSYEDTFLPKFRDCLSGILRKAADHWRKKSETHPCCTVSGSLFAEPGVDAVIPGHLRPLRDETLEQYKRRLQSLEDSELRPLAGKRIEAMQGAKWHDFCHALVDEIDSRFGWLSAVESAVWGAQRAQSCQSIRDLQKLLAECRRNRMLASSLPDSVHSLLRVIDQDTVARYAAQDAEATLAVWRKLNSILEDKP